MRTETIEKIETWYSFSRILHELDYIPWQYQFDIGSPEGFQARFRDPSGKEIMIITHNIAVHDAIFEYRHD